MLVAILQELCQIGVCKGYASYTVTICHTYACKMCAMWVGMVLAPWFPLFELAQGLLTITPPEHIPHFYDALRQRGTSEASGRPVRNE